MIPLSGRALANVDMALDLISSNAEDKRKRRVSEKGKGGKRRTERWKKRNAQVNWPIPTDPSTGEGGDGKGF